MTINLKDKVAIVTGAGGAGNIGEAYATALCEAGAAIVVADMDGAGAKATAEKLVASGKRAKAFTVDVRDTKLTDEMVAFTKREFGRIDILVNNAAYMKPVEQPLLDYPKELWQLTLDINVTGVLNCIRSVAPTMIAQKSGRIVNQSSIGAFGPAHAYGISKLAVQSLTMTLADELGWHGITVNAIAPGAIKTPAGDAARTPAFDEYIKSAPLGGIGAPQELCGALLYFVSDAARWVTGQIIRVDGGLIRRPT